PERKCLRHAADSRQVQGVCSSSNRGCHQEHGGFGGAFVREPCEGGRAGCDGGCCWGQHLHETQGLRVHVWAWLSGPRRPCLGGILYGSEHGKTTVSYECFNSRKQHSIH